MDNLDEKLSAIRDLLSVFPATHADPEGAARGYLLAAEIYELQDVQEAVRLLVAGLFSEHDGRYAPTPPQLGRACRHALGKRLRAVEVERIHRPQLPAPDVQVSSGAKARVDALMEKFRADMQAKRLQSDVTEQEKHQESKRRIETREAIRKSMEPPMDRASMLHRLGFSVGDPDGDAEVA